MWNASTRIVTTIVGNGTEGFSDGPGTSAMLGAGWYTYFAGVSTDAAGNVYFADPPNHRVRKWDAHTFIVTTVVGNGTGGFRGDGGAGTATALYLPQGVAIDGAGNVVVSDSANQRIRMMWAPPIAQTPTMSATRSTTDSSSMSGTRTTTNSKHSSPTRSATRSPSRTPSRSHSMTHSVSPTRTRTPSRSHSSTRSKHPSPTHSRSKKPKFVR